MEGVILEDEQTPDLQRDCKAEKERMLKSRVDRQKHKDNLQLKLEPKPPTMAELHRVVVYVDNPIVLPSNWHAAAPMHEALITQRIHDATVFISNSPWDPNISLLSWAAALVGGWIMTPEVLLGQPGPCIKYNKALQTKRAVWFSIEFRASEAHLWVLILELLNKINHQRRPILDVRDYCNAKVRAANVSRSAEVLALVTQAEHAANPLPHVFSPRDFLHFIKHQDDTRTCIGLHGM